MRAARAIANALIFVESDILSSATVTATKSAFADTKQSAPLPKLASKNVAVPQALWITLTLPFILCVLLAWKAFVERAH